MSLFSFNLPKQEKVLLFDLESESLSCSMVLFSSKEKPEILFYEKIDFGNSINFGIKKYLSSMVDSFDRMSKNVRQKYMAPSGLLKKVYKVDSLCINIASPWILSQSKNVKVKNDKPFVVDEAFIKKMRAAEAQDIFNASLPKDQQIKDKFKIFEEHIVQIRLNGYKIENVLKKNINSFEANVFLSIIQNDILDKIISSINKNLVSEKNFFHSFILSGFSFVRDAYPAKNDFVFLDISGETTEVCIAKDDAVDKIFTFPFGKRIIFKRVSEKLKVPEEMVKSLINMKCQGNCDEKTMGQVEEAIDIAVKEWRENLFKIFKEISPRSDIPKDIFIVSDDEVSGIVGKKIKEDRLVGHSIVNDNFKVSVLENYKFSPFIKKNGIVVDDVHQKLAIILIDKFLKNNNG